MRILHCLVCLSVFLFSFTGFSQKVVRSFKGRVVDSATLIPIRDVSICLYRASDTSLVNFGFTTPNGNFNVSTTSKDSLIIIFSLVGFNEHIKREPAVVHDWNFREYDDIKLSTAPFTLQAVSAKTAAIRMKGDTMEINATKFKVLPGSDVAQLFKKIPGFEVNVKGEIKVGGASVEKIMVDGSDFFGNNPGMVSKNLTADMIETVQVFDEKNEDGSPKMEQTKIINLKLKKGKRNGMFGDALAGYGTQERYEAGLRLNSFRNDRKVSFIVNSNNINETGFDFGFSNWHSAQNDERNGRADNNNFFYSNSSANNTNEGNINNKLQAGVSYFNEFSKKRKFSFDVFADRNAFNSRSASSTSNPVNDSIRRFNLDSNNLDGLANSASASIDFTQVKDSTLRLETGIRTSFDLNTINSNRGNIITFNSTPVNIGVNTLKNELMSNYFRVTGFVEKKWRKNIRYKGSLSGNFRNNINRNDLYQYLNNTTDTFNNKTGQNINRQEYLLKVFGQMPLSKFWSLNLSADRWQQDNHNRQLTNGTQQSFQNSFENSYTIPIDTLSVDFYNRIEQYSAHPYVSFYKKGYYFYAGATFMNVDLDNKNASTGEAISNHYIKTLPSIGASYYSESMGYMALNVQKAAVFPTSSDLLPVLNLSNNYMRQTGNSNLLPQETYSANLYLNFYKLKRFKYIYCNSQGSFSDNAKIYINEVNKEGIIIQKPVNETGKRDYSISIGFSKKLGKKFSQNTYISNNWSRNPTYFNDQKTYNTSNNWYLSPGMDYVISDSLEAGAHFSMSTQDFRNNLNEKSNYKQVTFWYSFDMRCLLKTGTEINTSISFNDQRNVPAIGKVITVWNFYVQQPIGKKGKFNIKFTAYDILKQNTSISRMSSGNYVTTSQNNQLTQYFMLTLVYKIKKTAGDEETFDYTY